MSWKLEGLSDGTFAQKLLDSRTTWFQNLKDCPQDPIHHAEGDVLTHVLLVCQELIKLPQFLALNDLEKQILAWAAILHDVSKPSCNIFGVDGRISSPGHAAKGAVKARGILWDLDCPFEIREEICGLVKYHMTVAWILERDDPERLIRKISLACRCDYLVILATADMLGRKCQDQQDMLERVELFRQLAEDAECLNGPAKFASALCRYQYFQGSWHNPETPPYENFKSKVILLSGLPGSGKDTWIEKKGPHWPVISLDKIRQELGISAKGNQGKVLELARERAREFLRRGQAFIWNATNTSRRIRSKPISLFLEYGAHVKIVYLEQPAETLEKQNRDREAMVPWKVIQGMINKWEVPSLTEAHEIKYVI